MMCFETASAELHHGFLLNFQDEMASVPSHIAYLREACDSASSILPN